MKLILSLALILITNPSFGKVEIIWRRLDIQYFYKDQNLECSTKSFAGNFHLPAESYLVLEMVDEKVKEARISNYPKTWTYQWIYKAIELNPNEIDSIELFRDKKGKDWVKKFSLSERIAKWLIFYPSQSRSYCKVPSLPSKINFAKIDLSFETEGLEQGVGTAHGQWINLEGQTGHGLPFEAKLRLIQREAF